MERVGYSSAFTFVYSKRAGTVAEKMPNQVPEEISKRRIMKLVDVVNGLTREYSKTYLGKTIEILCEGYDDKKGMYLGRDEYGRMGYFKSEENVLGEFVNIKILNANGVSLIGERIKGE